MAGICSKQTWRAYAEPISMLHDIVNDRRVSDWIRFCASLGKMTHLSAILPFKAKEKAFMNSVVLGTSANKVIPRNFSSIPEPWRTTSTTSTRISAKSITFFSRVLSNAQIWMTWLTCNRSVQDRTGHQDTGADHPAPARTLVPTRFFLFLTDLFPVCWLAGFSVSRMSVLPQRADGRRGDGPGEIFRSQVVGQLHRR